MIYYPNNNYQIMKLGRNNRSVLVPFVLGGLLGGGLVGLSRPNNYGYQYNQYPQNFNPYMPYGFTSYSYYVPRPF